MLKMLFGLSSIRTTPSFNADSCTRNMASGCELCVAACPVEALFVPTKTVGGWNAPPNVDMAQCVGCGICAAACPTQAIDDVGPVPSELVTASHEANGDEIGFGIACEPSDKLLDYHPAFDELDIQLVSCLGAVNGETLAACASQSPVFHAAQAGGQSAEISQVLSKGKLGTQTSQTQDLPTVYAITANCAKCPLGVANVVDKNIGLGMQLAAELGGKVARVEVSRAGVVVTNQSDTSTGKSSGDNQQILEYRDVSHRLSQQDQPELAKRSGVHTGEAAIVSRRDLVAGWWKPKQQDDQVDVQLTPRELLLQAAQQTSGINQVALQATEHFNGLSFISLPTLHNTGKTCIGCNACTAVCPTQALTRHDNSFWFSAQACVECGECVRVCQEDVLKLGERTPSQPVSQIVVTYEELPECSKCGIAMVNSTEDASTLCAGCSSAPALVSSVWDMLG